MDQNRFSAQDARRFFDFFGERYDWFSGCEAQAKAEALRGLEQRAGEHILNVGLGTGKEHAALQAAVGPQGAAFGLNLSRCMPAAAHKRIWKLAYALTLVTCDGCRPMQLNELARAAGFEQVERQGWCSLSSLVRSL
jgi:ubiquinone/menaquinone biosynthesis C-methylase UbiE